MKTERIIIRHFNEDDLNDFYDYASIEGIGEMAGWPTHKSIEESRKILDMFIKDKNQYALVLKETNKVIGSFGFKDPNKEIKKVFKDRNSSEVGYVLSKKYWGQGLMPEVLTFMIEYAFKKMGIDLISINHFKTNTQSRRVIEKCGGVYYKDCIFHSASLDRSFESRSYVILKEDYIK